MAALVRKELLVYAFSTTNDYIPADIVSIVVLYFKSFHAIVDISVASSVVSSMPSFNFYYDSSPWNVVCNVQYLLLFQMHYAQNY